MSEELHAEDDLPWDKNRHELNEGLIDPEPVRTSRKTTSSVSGMKPHITEPNA